MTTPIETREFQSEARQLLQLMIHSIYSNKDTFLRELVSNASDALDKLRLESFRDKDLVADTDDLHIEIETDPAARTLTVRDNGIGMSRDEVIGLIGTIAKSGTAEFLRQLREAQDAAGAQDLIGQFGVGFYASFMVADKVTLTTRRAGTEGGVRWESAGEGTYTLEDLAEAPQGTAVTLHLKPVDADDNLPDYTVPAKIRQIVRRYSDFLTWPVQMAADAPPESATDAAEETDAADTGVVDGETAETTENSDSAPAAPTMETLNSGKALWARPQSEVEASEYAEFYRHISHDWTDPLETIRLQAEGTFEYQALLFLPARAPMDLFMRERKRGVQLYVKRVFIMDDCEALMPEYLRFVKGVVDAADLSLNVSRESLQADRHIAMMRRRLVKKVLSTVKEMVTGNPQRYATFWSEFGRAVKEGLLDEPDNRETILEICSFDSTHTGTAAEPADSTEATDSDDPADSADPAESASTDGPTTLRQYVERMKPGQEHIYYLTGESRTVIENSPHMEAFRAKGFEVLLLSDPVDEMWVESGVQFDGKDFQSIAKGQVDLDTEEERKLGEAEREKRAQDFQGLLGWLSDTLGERVKQVRLSSRLTTSPACIVGDTGDFTPQLEKMYRAMGQQLPTVKRILELNPTHPLVEGLRAAHAARPDDPGLADTAELLHGMALLAEGGELDDPSRFIGLLAGRLQSAL